MNAPEISVITVTSGRRELLFRKLETLKAQTLDRARFELLLCVNGDPDTLAALEAAELPFGTVLLSFETNEGSARARNACAARARGRLLYFSDDDALLAPDTLLRHLQFHEGRTPCVAVGGVDWESEDGLERMRPKRVHYWNLHGVNTSLPKRAFDEVGGFPEWLTSYGFEDVVLGYLLHQRGVPTIALLDVAVRHIGANPMRGLQPEKARSAGRNAVKIIRSYPELAFRLGVHPALLALKRLALMTPLAALWKHLGEGSFRYERAYLEGVLEEKNHV